MEAGLMKIVRSAYRRGTHDSYFSLCRPIHRGKMSGNIWYRRWSVDHHDDQLCQY